MDCVKIQEVIIGSTTILEVVVSSPVRIIAAERDDIITVFPELELDISTGELFYEIDMS